MKTQSKCHSALATALVTSEHAKDYEHADKIISQMKNAVYRCGKDPEDVLQEYGLEPDYFFDLMEC